MSLDPKIAAYLAQGDTGAASDSLAGIRAATEVGLRRLHGAPEPVVSVTDYEIAGAVGSPIMLRVYLPVNAPASGARPAIVFAHGGGWCLCSVDLYDNPCRALANATGCMVLSVDYRLAPEHPFPTPLEDVYAALVWTTEHAVILGIDPARIAVGGDSAGANLAAAAALLARERSGPAIAHQLLMYPALDDRLSSASCGEFAKGYSLTLETMRFCWSTYLGGASGADSDYAAPLRARSLHGLPPATVMVCEFDPLRDEGVAYAQRLRGASVDVSCITLEGMIHGCIHMLGLTPAARQLFDAAAAGLRRTA
ncbi:alpha/beta hydrolase [Massilia sp. CCM 8734]|uniref:alpha/beta hydrolase n=1 Tax=Massilia sp. CCM 8734 TaxID=2609283 RepID=UPI00142478FE|nr:alpha/beta hydrolase [Massilia sp. CCM 8734]NHZ97648.1 alpha/beta hydrolase fold domain-containing protein [Massilia sp. CCM 8734]